MMQIDSIEFPATDIEATKSFYEEAFGWQFTDYGPDYVSFEGAGLDGGLHSSGDGLPGGVLVVLYLSDLEAALAAVEGARAEIVDPIFSFPGGRRFHFLDPNSNTVAIRSEDPEQGRD